MNDITVNNENTLEKGIRELAKNGLDGNVPEIAQEKFSYVYDMYEKKYGENFTRRGDYAEMIRPKYNSDLKAEAGMYLKSIHEIDDGENSIKYNNDQIKDNMGDMLIDIDRDISPKNLSDLLNKMGYETNEAMFLKDEVEMPLDENGNISEGTYVTVMANNEIGWTDDYDIWDSMLPGEEDHIHTLSSLSGTPSAASIREEFKDVLGYDEKFKGQLLGRLDADCSYYLGNGERNTHQLWALDEKKHVGLMREIYKELKEKPKNITMEKIDNLEKQMIPAQERTLQTPVTKLQVGDKVNTSGNNNTFSGGRRTMDISEGRATITTNGESLDATSVVRDMAKAGVDIKSVPEKTMEELLSGKKVSLPGAQGQSKFALCKKIGGYGLQTFSVAKQINSIAEQQM